MAKKNVVNSFNDGLSMDIAKDVSKASTITDANNAVIMPKGGETFELQNMQGNELKSFLPEGYFPKAIKVFNGIAYIVSNKYNEEGNYEYTEIGTYPSPEWSALFPDKIEISNFDHGNINNLSEVINTSISQGLVENKSIQTVYSFALVDSYSNGGASYDNMFFTQYYNWARHTGNCSSGQIFSGPCDYGRLEHMYVRFDVFDVNDVNITDRYKDNITVDIIRIQDKNSDGTFKIQNDWNIATDLRIYNGHISGTPFNFNYLRAYNYYYASHQYVDNETFGEDMIKRTYGTYYYNDIFDAPSSNISSLYYNKATSKIVFVVKCDVGVDEPIYFKVSPLSYTTNGPWKINSLELETKNGSYGHINPDSWGGLGSTYYDEIYNWKQSVNNSYLIKEEGISRIIFARHKIRYNINDKCNCSFYGDLSNKKHYIAFRPLITNKINFPQNDYQQINYNHEYTHQGNELGVSNIDNIICHADKDIFMTALSSSASFPFDKVSNIKIYREDDNNPFSLKKKGIPSKYTSSIPSNGDYIKYPYSGDEHMIIEIEDGHLNEDYYVCYYNKFFNEGQDPDITTDYNTKIGLDIGKIFNEYFQQFDSLYDVMLTPQRDNVYATIQDPMRSRYRNLFMDGGTLSGLQSPGLIIILWLRSNIISSRPEDFDNKLLLNNGRRYFNLGGNNIISESSSYIAKIKAINGGTSYNGENDFSEYDNEITVYTCNNDGEKIEVNFDLNNECCDSVNKNVLLHLHFDYDFGTGIQLLFSSVYSYTGSIFKLFTGNNNDIILLFQGVIGNTLSLNIISDVSNVLIDILNSMTIIKGYSYCLTDNYSHLQDKYCPIFNFNTDINTPDIYLLDSQNSNFAFRSNILVEDNDNNYELELEPNYDSTINMIINDKKSKVKLINSRFAYDPSNNRCFIPQKYGFNDDNIYYNKSIHGTELIRRTDSVLKVSFNDIIYGGELFGGSYIYYFKYIDSDGNTTDIINHTLPISVFNLETNEYDNNGEKAGVNTNAAVKITLSNFDRLYKHIEISFVYNAGELNSERSYYKIKKLYNIPLSDELTIIHTGLETLEKINYNDIAKEYNHHLSVNSIAQGKGRLILSNEVLSDVSIYSEIKRLALNMNINESFESVTDPNFFKKSSNIYNGTGYWRGETYQLGIALKLIKGGLSPVFNPRGIDNIAGNALYSNTSSINQFVGSYGENPYGIYRTSMGTSMYKVNDHNGLMPNSFEITNVYLTIEGLQTFLDNPLVKSISKGYIIYRKDRIKDTLIEGFVTPTFKVPFGPGYVNDESADTSIPGAHRPAIGSSSHEYLRVNNLDPHSQFVSITNYTDADSGNYKYNIAPFGLYQNYVGSGIIGLGTIGYPVGDPSHKYKLLINNLLIRQNDYVNDRFGFISADLIADAEHFSSDFQGKGKYYMVNKGATKFINLNGNLSTRGIGIPYTMDYESFNIAVTHLDDELKIYNTIISNDTESLYVPEKMDTSSMNGFSTKLDHTNSNFNTISYIGVAEGISDDGAEPSIPSLLIQNYIEDNPYGFLTRVYLNDSGVLPFNNWKTLYASKYQEGGYFPITETKSLDDVVTKVYGGDCFINKSYVRVLTKNGLDDNFDNYSNIWDYIGEVQQVNMQSKDFNKEDPASNSWFSDNEYMALKRARLIPKGMWVEVVHESNYNLALRTSEYKSAQEKVKYGKDRTYLTSLKKIKSYIPAEFGSSQLDSKGYNKGYSIFDGPIYNFALNDAEKLLRIFYSRIEASDISVKGELKNGYRELFGLNYKDYDTQYGYISKVITFFDRTYVLFERGLGILPLSEKTQVTGADGGVYIDNINILGTTLSILSGDNGTIHPDSVIGTKTGGYFYDHNNNAILKFIEGSAVQDITAYTIETFLVEFKKKLEGFRSLSSKYISYNVKSNYDILTGDITFTFYVYEGVKDNLPTQCDYSTIDIVPNNDNIEYSDLCNKKYNNIDYCPDGFVSIGVDDDTPEYTQIECEDIPISKSPFTILYSSSIYYNERIGKWVSPISFNPNFIFALNDKTFSMNLIKNQNRIYIHRSENVKYCFFYDEQHNFSFEFIVNQNQYAQKVLENLMIVSNERVPITISYDVDDKRSLIDDVDSLGVRTRNQYNLDFTQDVLTRRFEVKLIGMAVNNDWGIFLNTSDSYYHQVDVNDTFEINNIQYYIGSITNILTDEGIEMPRLTIMYYDGSTWEDVETVVGSYIYNQLFGFTIKINSINIINSNSDYIEDHMWVQVQLKETEDGWREVRDRNIRVKINYDGIDKTFIHSIISTVDESLN